MKILFLSWGIPWPPQGGGTLRTFGLLKELSKVYKIELIVFSKRKLSVNQKIELQKYASSIIRVPMKGIKTRDKVKVLSHMFIYRMPYHSAILSISFYNAAEVKKYIQNFEGLVYASYGHWGTLVLDKNASNWILDQQNADIDFWRAYARQASTIWLKIAALINWKLAAMHFPRVYSGIGQIISVCEEDRKLTLSVDPKAKVSVIENGVDCSYYIPNKKQKIIHPQILFTGTSAPRNITALRKFIKNIWPMIHRKRPEVKMLVAGNFLPKAQTEFRRHKNIHFTGRVKDIRPYFNQSHVYIMPFGETHGSKLKIAEAMAMGMAIVSTTQGIRGFPLIDGESVFITDDKEQFASYVLKLLGDEKLREQLGNATRKVALSTIDWKILGKRLRKIIDEIYTNISG